MVNLAEISALKADLARESRRLGFADCGVTAAGEDPLRAQRLEHWLGEGRHGEMEWMETRAHHRRSPQGLWPEAQRVIALGMGYAPAADPLAEREGRARISVYAQGSDYHDTVKKALNALARWLVAEAAKRGLGDIGVKVFVDTAPVMEKPLGQAAGLGWQGKHTNLVSRDHGSWLFLGAIYTTLELPVDEPGSDRCGSCNACQTACPTEAIIFGNLNDPESRVAKLKNEPRNYDVLADLNTRPRASYLGAIRNTNSELGGGKGHGNSHGGQHAGDANHG